MIIKHNSDKIRYTGRWNIGENSATSTANRNYFEFMCVVRNRNPKSKIISLTPLLHKA